MLQQFNFQDHTVRVVLGGVVILHPISDSLGRSQEMRVI